MSFRKNSYVALFDACVLFSPGLTSLAIDLARTGVYRAKWTSKIHEEWTAAVLTSYSEQHPEVDLETVRAKLERRRAAMDSAVLDCLVDGYELIESALQLPDINDRHVLAAAIHCKASAIVTYNIDDFPSEVLATYNIEAQHPDDFFRHQTSLDTSAVIEAVKGTRQRRLNPSYTAEQMLHEMRTSWGLTVTADMLLPYVRLL